MALQIKSAAKLVKLAAIVDISSSEDYESLLQHGGVAILPRPQQPKLTGRAILPAQLGEAPQDTRPQKAKDELDQ